MHPVMERVSAENVECFLNLWQFLGYDFSAMNQMPLKSNGTYALPDDIKAYYSDEVYISYLVRVEGELAGFAVIKCLNRGLLISGVSDGQLKHGSGIFHYKNIGISL